MIWFVAVCVAAVALVAIYMTSPTAVRRRISAAEFLVEAPRIQHDKPRFRLTLPARACSLPVRLLVLVCLALGIWLQLQRVVVTEKRSLGVAFVVDVSDSMRTSAGTSDHLKLAKTFVRDALDRLEGLDDTQVCTRLDTFGIDHRQLLTHATPATLKAALNELSAEPEGTNLAIPRRILDSYANANANANADSHLPTEESTRPHCIPDYVVVVSDQPAPAASENGSVRLIWKDVSTTRFNVAISRVKQEIDPLSGSTLAVDIQLTRWGRGTSKLIIEGPEGRRVYDPVWNDESQWTLRLPVSSDGEVQLTLTDGGAYDGDDRARILVSTIDALTLDWRGQPDLPLMQALNIRLSATTPDLVVESTGSAADAEPVPVIHLGAGLSDGESLIGSFIEDHPILQGVNFDVLERFALPSAKLPTDASPINILAGLDGQVWIAALKDQVWLPAAPSIEDSESAHLSLTMFLNAVRWLSVGYKQPVPATFYREEGTPLQGVDVEGAVYPTRSTGTLDDLRPVVTVRQGEPVWPWFVLAALVLLTLDRLLTALFLMRYERV